MVFLNFRAQGTIEYLVLIAIIVVLSLLLVGLLMTQTEPSSNVSSVSTKISQSSGQISVLEAVVDSDRNGLVSLGNNSGGTLTITRLNVDGVDVNYSNVSMSQGDIKTFSLDDMGSNCSCESGVSHKTCTLIVYVTSEYGLEKQYSTTINVDCVNDAVPIGTIVEPSTPTPAPIAFSAPYIWFLAGTNPNLVFSRYNVSSSTFDLNVPISYSDNNALFGVVVDLNGDIWRYSPLNALLQFSKYVYKFSSTTGDLLRVIEVGTQPRGLAFDANSNLWVINSSDNNISKITGEGVLLGRYTLGAGLDNVVADAYGHIWATGGTSVYKIDSSTGSVLSTLSFSKNANGIAVDASGYIWITLSNGSNPYDAEVYKHRISDDTNMGSFDSVSDPAARVAVDLNGNVWVAYNIGCSPVKCGYVKKYNGSTGAVIGTYTGSGLIDGPTTVAVDFNNNIWVKNGANEPTIVLDSQTGALLASYTGLTVWADDPSGLIYRYFVLGRR